MKTIILPLPNNRLKIYKAKFDRTTLTNLMVLFVIWTLLIAQLVKNLLAIQKTLVRFLGWKDLLEKG